MSVVGYGNLGKATAALFGIENYVDLKGSTTTLERAAHGDVVFVCLPTPTVDGRCFTQDIEQIVRDLRGYGDALIVLRSTVIPGTADRLMDKYEAQIVSNPAFGVEARLAEDEKWPDMVVLGGRDEDALEMMEGLYYRNALELRWERYNSLADIISPFVITDNITAEMIKYALNTLFTTKVVFANEIARLCHSIGVEYDVVRDALYLSQRVGHDHLDAHGRCGGACLPKDLEAFTRWHGSELLSKVRDLNDRLPEYVSYRVGERE